MKVLSATEVAAKTSMSVSNVRRLARDKKIPRAVRPDREPLWLA